MEIVYIFNGLGNQMSQYAFALRKKSLGHNVGCVFKDTAHNGIELGQLFGIDTHNPRFVAFFNFLYGLNLTIHHHTLKSIILFILRLCGVKSYVERLNYAFQPELLIKNRSVGLYIGGWHHYKYFNDIGDEIKALYKFPVFKKAENQEIAGAAQADNAVAIHIRRGDFMDKTNYHVFGCVCSETYYQKALTMIEGMVQSPVYYVFSNDMEWAKGLLSGRNAVYVDWNTGNDSWADMALMSKFKNIIIPNSTFSWWAAWLGRSDKYVLCPPVFVYDDPSSDVFLPEWIRVE